MLGCFWPLGRSQNTQRGPSGPRLDSNRGRFCYDVTMQICNEFLLQCDFKKAEIISHFQKLLLKIS